MKKKYKKVYEKKKKGKRELEKKIKRVRTERQVWKVVNREKGGRKKME